MQFRSTQHLEAQKAKPIKQGKNDARSRPSVFFPGIWLVSWREEEEQRSLEQHPGFPLVPLELLRESLNRRSWGFNWSEVQGSVNRRCLPERVVLQIPTSWNQGVLAQSATNSYIPSSCRRGVGRAVRSARWRLPRDDSQ